MDDEERSIVFFKNKWIPITISIISLILLSIAFFFGTVPSPVTWKADWSNALIDFLLIFGGFIFFMGVGVLVWYLNVERKAKLNGTDGSQGTAKIAKTKPKTAKVTK
ncbi:amino acid permease family protein [Spiroplasma clarkii]|nr:hypothetical protein [Spiroplasma clarkii]ARU91593.1 amino acid permease family protein [Spiroplasma clarkii]